MAAIKSIFVITFAVVLGYAAADSDMLQDTCVADLTAQMNINGYPCKAANVSAADFHSDVIARPGVTNTPTGSVVTLAGVPKIPGLNTLGVSLARIDIAPGSINPFHSHPRASEVIFILEGEVEVAFITTTNQLIGGVIKKGEVFVFPKGLMHYQKNVGKGPASVLSAFNSQSPGTQSIANTLFTPAISVPVDVLAKGFKMSTNDVEEVKAKFAPKQ